MLMDANNFAGEDLSREDYETVTQLMNALKKLQPTTSMKCMVMAMALIYRFASWDHITKEEFITGVGKSIRKCMDLELVAEPGTEEIPHK